MPLYDILNEFQKGHSYTAAVVKTRPRNTNMSPIIDVENPENSCGDPASNLAAPLLYKPNEISESVVDIEKISKQTSVKSPGSVRYSSNDIEEGEVIGIITLEDVFEELLQEEIVDETDEFVGIKGFVLLQLQQLHQLLEPLLLEPLLLEG